MKQLIKSPTTGSSIIDFNAAGTPKWSAITPNRVTPIPPVPIAKPARRPEATPRLLGRSSCAITMVTVKLEIKAIPTTARLKNNITPCVMKIRGNNSVVKARENVKYRLYPNRSAKGDPIRVPIAPPKRNTETRVPA
jgi:hypothetical protein